jgi:hypothetical protein
VDDGAVFELYRDRLVVELHQEPGVSGCPWLKGGKERT